MRCERRGKIKKKGGREAKKEWYKQKKKAGKSRKERNVVGEVAMSSNLHNVSCFSNYTRQDVGVAVHLGRSYLYNHIRETFAPATEDGNGSWRTKRMWDVVPTR